MRLSNTARHKLSRAGLLVILPLVAAVLLVPAIAAKAANDAEATRPAARSETDSDDRVYPKVYRIGDLPIWRTAPESEKGEKELDYSVLVALIKSAVDPESWQEKASLSVYSGNRSLVISQTDSNHQKISDLLKSLRKADKYGRDVRRR